MFGDKRPLNINRPFIGCCLVDAAHGWFHKSFPIAHMGRWAPMEPICLTISRMTYIIVFGTIHSIVMVRTPFENSRAEQRARFHKFFHLHIGHTQDPNSYACPYHIWLDYSECQHCAQAVRVRPQRRCPPTANWRKYLFPRRS